MGQYYNVAYFDSITMEFKVTNRSVENCGYIGAKLTEHSWFGNTFYDSFCAMLYDMPKRVIWCGDYAEDDDLSKILWAEKVKFEQIWVEGVKYTTIPQRKMDWYNKYIINIDKGVAIDVNRYWNASCVDMQGETWCLNPIPILCSVGNGRGGGDYEGLCMEEVGKWAGDHIYTCDDARGNKVIDIAFKESWYCR